MKIFRDFRKLKPGSVRNQQKAFSKKHPLSTVTIARKLLKSYQFVISESFWLYIQEKHFPRNGSK